MPFNADILNRLADATVEEITSALAALRQEAVKFQGQEPTPAVLETLDSYATHAEALRGELTRREKLASDYTDRMARLADLTGDLPAGPEGTPEPAPTPDSTPHQAPAQPEPQPAQGDKPEDEGDQGEPQGDEGQDDNAVTAAGRRRLGSTNKRSAAPALRTFGTVHYRTVAAAGDPDTNPGTQLDRQGIADAFARRLATLNAHDGAGVQRFTVATRRATFPESRRLVTGNWLANKEKLEQASQEARDSAKDNALVAAGLCAPLENIYDIPVIGDDDRPIRNALVRMNAPRGGVQFRLPIQGVSQTGGIGTWDAAADTADPIVAKTCVEIDCPALDDAQIEALYLCLQFAEMSTRFDPEYMDSVVRSQEIAAARFSENRIYSQMLAASKNVAAPPVLLGAVRDILVTLDKMIAYYRNVHRLNDEQPLRWIAPLWALYLMRADMTRQMVGDGTQVLHMTDAAIQRFLTDRNVSVTWHLDGIDPADITALDPDVVVPAQFYTSLVTNSLVPGFPDAISSLLYREGDWFHLDGGSLDLGLVRDSTLISQNRFRTFSEEFGMPFFRGIESFHLVIPVQPRGGSAATVSTASSTD